MKYLLSKGLILSSVLLLGACHSTDHQATDDTQKAEDAASDHQSPDSSSKTITITDNAEHEVTVPLSPQKIAVFDNGQLDIIKQLGLSDRVVATATNRLPEYLSEFSELPVAGTLHEIDLEIANAAQPELAIVAGRSRDSYNGLAEFTSTLDFSNTSHNIWETLKSNLTHYGEIFSVQSEAQAIISNLDKQLTSLSDQASQSNLNALFLMSSEGALSAYGPGSRFGFVHDLFGYTPVDDTIDVSRHGMNVSFEYVLDKNPDVIFLLDRSAAIGKESDVNDFKNNPLIQDTTAYKNDAIIYLSPDMWYLAEGGVESFTKMMEESSQPLH